MTGAFMNSSKRTQPMVGKPHRLNKPVIICLKNGIMPCFTEFMTRALPLNHLFV